MSIRIQSGGCTDYFSKKTISVQFPATIFFLFKKYLLLIEKNVQRLGRILADFQQSFFFCEINEGNLERKEWDHLRVQRWSEVWAKSPQRVLKIHTYDLVISQLKETCICWKRYSLFHFLYPEPAPQIASNQCKKQIFVIVSSAMNISDMMDTSILSKVFMLWANRFQHTMLECATSKVRSLQLYHETDLRCILNSKTASAVGKRVATCNWFKFCNLLVERWRLDSRSITKRIKSCKTKANQNKQLSFVFLEWFVYCWSCKKWSLWDGWWLNLWTIKNSTKMKGI